MGLFHEFKVQNPTFADDYVIRMFLVDGIMNIVQCIQKSALTDDERSAERPLALNEFRGCKSRSVHMLDGSVYVKHAQFKYHIQWCVTRVVCQKQVRCVCLLEVCDELRCSGNDFRTSIDNTIHVDQIA